jgi:tRNA pseudouridine38-40 synthase
MKNIKLIIEYDGTNYHGWQDQRNAIAIQAVIEKAIRELTGEDCRLTGSGRTDAGVHALGQVANFFTMSDIPPEKFAYALNSILPEDIIIKRSEEVSIDFHARYSARGKRYWYIIYNSEQPSALMRNRACHIRQPLSLEAMKAASSYFKGTHDFAAFMSTGSSVKTTERTIYDCIIEQNGEIIKLDISGNGFLYNMVRIIAGTLAEIGMGRIPPDRVSEIIIKGDRKLAGKTAPSHGLYLVEVFY